MFTANSAAILMQHFWKFYTTFFSRRRKPLPYQTVSSTPPPWVFPALPPSFRHLTPSPSGYRISGFYTFSLTLHGSSILSWSSRDLPPLQRDLSVTPRWRLERAWIASRIDIQADTHACTLTDTHTKTFAWYQNTHTYTHTHIILTLTLILNLTRALTLTETLKLGSIHTVK